MISSGSVPIMHGKTHVQAIMSLSNICEYTMFDVDVKTFNSLCRSVAYEVEVEFAILGIHMTRPIGIFLLSTST